MALFQTDRVDSAGIVIIDKLATLSAAYDGPIPTTEYAAARFGRGAFDRLAYGADMALIEARAGTIRSALAQLRLALGRRVGAMGGEHDRRLALALAEYRRAALVCLAPDRS